MSMFETILPLFAETGFVPEALDLRETICACANQAHAELAAADPTARAAAAASLEMRLAEPGLVRNPFLGALAHGLLHAAGGQPEQLEAAVTAALAEPAVDVGVGVNTLFQIDRLAFVNRGPGEALERIFDYPARHRWWRSQVRLAEAAAETWGTRPKGPFVANDRVLILTDQFLQPPHAPTKDALEYGRRFQDAGRTVMIASTCALGDQLYSPVLPGVRCSVNAALAAIPALTFEGRTYAYHQPASGRFNNETFAETLRAVQAFAPALVLAIGGQSLVAELLAPRAFVVQYPTFAGLPTVSASHFFTWRTPTADEAAMLERLGLASHHLFAHHPGFEPPERTTRLTRAQFGLPADAFVFAVAGMRLGLDVDDAFLALMRRIRERRPQAHFMFVGEFDGYAERVGADPALAGAATHIGFHSDILAAYELADAYINPTRKGGGSAIVHALTGGLPTLTTAYGDAYEAARALPALADYAALADAACALAERGATYEAYLRAVREAASSLGGKGAVVERILAAYEAFAAERVTA